MAYRDTLTRLADTVVEKVLAVFTAWLAGRIERNDAIAVIASLIATGNARAVTLADVSLAATLTVELDESVGALGLLPPDDDLDRLSKGATTLLDIDDVTEARIERFARSEPLEAAANAYSDAVAASEHVAGWRRGLSPSACQLCQWWSRDGRVWPAEHKMPTHKGCTCTPIPVTAERNTP